MLPLLPWQPHFTSSLPSLKQSNIICSYAAIMCAACCCTFFKVTSLIKATEYISAVPGLHALNLTTSDAMYSALESHQHWYSSFAFFCAFEFTFMSLAELLVLNRYLDLAFKGLDRNESQNKVIRRYAVAGCFVVLFAMSSIISATFGIVYRLESNLRSSSWKNSNAKADYANAAQMFSEVLSLLIKAFLFIFISRMDLERLEKIERWTFTNLVPVRWQTIFKRSRHCCPCVHSTSHPPLPSFFRV